MQGLIKLTDAPRGYKHLEKFVFEVICGPVTKAYRRRVTYQGHLLRVVCVGAFSLPFKTDGRLERDIRSGIAPFKVAENPTSYSKNDECLIGMTLHLNLDKFTVLPAEEKK